MAPADRAELDSAGFHLANLGFAKLSLVETELSSVACHERAPQILWGESSGVKGTTIEQVKYYANTGILMKNYQLLSRAYGQITI